jgi:nucleoprotein TPR
MAAADVDVGYLSTHLGVPEETLTSVTVDPTVDLVKAVLQAVAKKAQEFEQLYADKLNVDIELEAAIHSTEARTQQLKATTDKALREVEEVRQKLKDEGPFISHSLKIQTSAGGGYNASRWMS